MLALKGSKNFAWHFCQNLVWSQQESGAEHVQPFDSVSQTLVAIAINSFDWQPWVWSWADSAGAYKAVNADTFGRSYSANWCFTGAMSSGGRCCAASIALFGGKLLYGRTRHAMACAIMHDNNNNNNQSL
jgi:hypothetical protein